MGEDSDSQQNAPTATNTVPFTLGPTINSMSDEAHHVFYGDPILSIRSLLKRYTYYAKWPHYPDSSASLADSKSCRLRYFFPDYPLYQGEVTSTSEPYVMEVQGGNTTAGSARPKVKWNSVVTSFMTFFTPAFVCRRGGIRWKYTTTFIGAQCSTTAILVAQPMVTLRVSRCPQRMLPKVVINDTALTTPTAVAFGGYNSLPSGAGGQFVTQTALQPTAEIELPFYNYHRFVTAFSNNVGKTGTVALGTDNNEYPYHQVVLECMRLDRTNGISIEAFCAAADDYSLFFYIGPPVLYSIVSTKNFIQPVESNTIFPYT